jgi:hypothetical protein
MFAAIATGAMPTQLRVGAGGAGEARTPESGVIQSPVCMHLCPQTMVHPRNCMVQPIFVKSTSHPALHISMMERNECNARPGMMCAARSLQGRDAMPRVHVCVERTRSPFGSQTMMGLDIGQIFKARASVVRK